MIPPRAADLRHRITIQSRSNSRDSYGMQVQGWSTLLSCWGDIQPQAGDEVYTAGAQQWLITHVIYIRYRAGITPANRAIYNGRTFNIISVLDVDERHHMLELKCVEGLI